MSRCTTCDYDHEEGTLHGYQRVAVEHLLRNPKAGLFLDMGLGKTASTLVALTPAHLPALVVAPKRVAEEVWPEEVPKWRPDLRVALAAGSPAQRMAALLSDADVVVIGRDNLRDAVGHSRRFRTFVMDELSGFKSRGSQRWKAGRLITKDMKHVWGLTGTPSPNGLMDLWAPMYLLDRGARLEPTLTRFRSRYFMPGRQLPSGVITEWLLRPEADAAIHRKIDDICLSMTSEGRIKLPPVTYNTVSVPLAPAIRRAYRKLKDDLYVNLELLGGIHSASTAAVLSNRLSQMSAGFLYHQDELGAPLPTYDILHRDKIAALREIVDGTGSPVLVFYRYRAELDLIRAEFPEMSTLDAPRAVERWNRGEIPVLAAHPASAGHGLNLQHGGHTIVWTSLTWSLEEWEQGNKRLARQGQSHPVVIHMLISPKTVDVAQRERVIEKKSVQDALIAHLESLL